MSDNLQGLTAALADRYTIERELGRGGMTFIFLAHDGRHDRKVALKVLRPEVTLASRTARFLNEIKVAAKLVHPNILPLFEADDLNGVVYYAMPYVPGETLRQRLNREGQLPVDSALAITRDVSSALDYAHRANVVHCDIKPENILLAEGKPVVMDFGIARAWRMAEGVEDDDWDGLIVGTAPYMSPEQATGSAKVDGRADIYSLGCVLFEMLAGHPPFQAKTVQEFLARHTLDAVPSIRAARPDVAHALEQVITKALAKVPAARYATAEEFREALAGADASPRGWRKAHTVAAVGLVAAVALAAPLLPRLTSRALASDQSVAVMPFTNLTGDSADAYFGEGISSDILNALSRMDGLRVVPVHASYLASHGAARSVQQLGNDLAVARILEGTFSRVGTQLKISTRLVRVSDSRQEWGDSYNRETKDIFAVEAEVSQAIAGALKLQLATGETTAPLVPPTQDLEAYDLYLRGRYHWNRRSGTNALKAIEYFEAAIAKDSTYALAYSGLADSYIWVGNDQVVPRPEAYPKAKAAALKAVALDPNSAEAHTSLGRVRYNIDWDWVGTEAELKRAILLNPRYPFAHSWYGYYLANVKLRYEEGVREALLGWQLDSLAPMIAQNLGLIYLQSGRFDEAEPILRKSIELEPGYSGLHRYLGDALLTQRRFAEARDAYDRSFALRPNSPATWAAQGAVLALTGQRDSALAILRQIRTRLPQSPMAEAMLAAQLGLLDEAAAAFESAIGSPFTMVPSQFHNRLFDPIRKHPRYISALRRISVEP